MPNTDDAFIRSTENPFAAYVARAARLQVNGGHSGFVCFFARTPHAGPRHVRRS